MADDNLETITAELRQIIFQNDTGFMIGSFINGNGSYKPLTALGQFLNPQPGLSYQLTGEWVNDKKYGRQFRVKSFQTLEPSDVSAIFKYLVRTAKYVGSKTGQDLVDTFGEDTLDILRTDPQTVADKIRGITFTKAQEIQQSLLANEINEKVMVELWGMLDMPGMRKALPGELIDRFGSNAAETVRQNPYILTDFSGVGFSLADRVALNIGYPADGIERKKAVILFCLSEIGQSAGDIWISKKDLVDKISEVVNIFNVLDGLVPLMESGAVSEDEGFYALSGLAENEKYVAEKIAEMIKNG